MERLLRSDCEPAVLELLDRAAEAAGKAHAPHSGFSGGAALRLGDGGIRTGCNVENLSYGLTICAERVVAASCVAEGRKDFEALALWTPTEAPSSPCGACRQFLSEFAPSLPLWIAGTGSTVLRVGLEELLPEAFADWREAGGEA